MEPHVCGNDGLRVSFRRMHAHTSPSPTLATTEHQAVAEVVKELLVDRGASIDRGEDGTARPRSDDDLSLAAAVVDTNDNGSVQSTEILRLMLFATVGAVASAHVVHNLYNDHVRQQHAADKTSSQVIGLNRKIGRKESALAGVQKRLTELHVRGCTYKQYCSFCVQESKLHWEIAVLEMKGNLLGAVAPDPTVQSGPRMVLMGWCAAVLMVVLTVAVALVHVDLSDSRSAVDTWTAVVDDVGGNGDGELKLSDVVGMVSLGLLVAATADALSK
jgi:hypothetical protein